MQVEILTFCDAAAEYGGRLNIIGATDTVLVSEVPFHYQRCAVVCRFRVARVEEGRHAVRLVLINADGKTLVQLNGQIDVQLGKNLTGAVNVIVNLNSIELTELGEYAIEIAVDGIQIGYSPLFVSAQHTETPAPP